MILCSSAFTCTFKDILSQECWRNVLQTALVAKYTTHVHYVNSIHCNFKVILLVNQMSRSVDLS